MISSITFLIFSKEGDSFLQVFYNTPYCFEYLIQVSDIHVHAIKENLEAEFE